LQSIIPRVVVLLVTACSDPSVSFPVAPVAAKAPPSGDIAVTSVDPTDAPQDTTLDIKVSGANFDRSASVALAIDGVVSPKVKTNSTRYVNGSQLVANITIAADADVALYDVMVLSGVRKPGIGTELFAVRQTGQVINPTATFTYYDVLAAANAGRISGDGRSATGSLTSAGQSVYDDGRCNVTSQIFENIEGDATMDPVGAGGRVRNCDTRTTRALTVSFGQPLYLSPGAPVASNVTGAHYTNVRQVASLVLRGDNSELRFRLMLRGTNLACDYLRYESRTLGGFTGIPIRITRIASRAQGDAEDAWEATPQPVDGRYLAFCEKGGTADAPVLIGVYDVNFRIKVVQE
jgi:hypothetical protein